MVSQHVNAQRLHASLLVRGQFAAHMVIPRERRGGEIFDPRFDPLHRPPKHDRAHDGTDIARIYANLVAKAAPDVGCNDVDFAFRDTRQHGDHGAHDVRRLRGEIDRQFALDLVEVRYTAAGLQRARVHALIADVLAHRERRAGKDLVSGRRIAHIPAKNVVVMHSLTVGTFRLAFQVLANDRSVSRHGLTRIGDHGQLFIFHLHQFDGVGRHVAILSNHKGHFLLLKTHLAVSEHHLRIACKRGHPMEIQGLEILSGEHREHAGMSQSRFLIDGYHPAVGNRAADEGAKNLARQFEIVRVVAFALDEACVLLAFPRATNAAYGILYLFCWSCHARLLIPRSACRPRTAPP